MLLEFRRFKCEEDSIDFNAYQIDAFLTGIGYDIMLPNTWHSNGSIQSSPLFLKSRVFNMRFNKNGMIKQIEVYHYSEYEWELIEEINAE
jgi:hypothetical protein